MRKPLITVSIRCSEQQRKDWMNAAERAEMSLSEYLRLAVDNGINIGVPSKSETKVLIKSIDKLIFELNRAGNNLNQLTRYSHQQGGTANGIDDAVELVEDGVFRALQMLGSLERISFKKLGHYQPRKSKEEPSNDNQN